MVIAAALVTLSFVIGRRVKNKVKDMPYECGIAPTGDARERFSVNFIWSRCCSSCSISKRFSFIPGPSFTSS